VFGQWGAQGVLTNRKFVTFMSSLIIMLPLSALKDISSLDRTSLLSIVAVIVIVLLILFRAPQVAGSSTFEIDTSQRWTARQFSITPPFSSFCHLDSGHYPPFFSRHWRNCFCVRLSTLVLLGVCFA
jgi:amino acid permease